MASAPVIYQYETLPIPSSIRLFTLTPGNPEDELSGKLEIVDLDCEPTYDAISYVWGSPPGNASIRVFSNGEAGELGIPENLAAAICRFRCISLPLTLWTDSICINQNNLDERSQQVSIMGSIYEKAAAVRIWLGEPDDEVELRLALACMDSLERCLPELEELNNAARDVGEINLANYSTDYRIHPGLKHYNNDEMHRMLNIPLLDSLEFKALQRLFNNSWVTRAWTWQETFLARERSFACGSYVWAGEKPRLVCRALSNLKVRSEQGTYDDIFIHMNTMIIGKNRWSSPNSEIDVFGGPSKRWLELDTLMEIRRGSACSNSSDLVYSLLGAARDCPPIEVNYRLSFETVFANTAFEIIRHREDLKILRGRERDREQSSLPTWVPDWRVSTSDVSTITDMMMNIQYNATASVKPLVELSGDAKILSLAGLEVDEVYVFYSDGGGMIYGDWANIVSQYIERTVDGEKFYTFTNESLARALRRIHFRDQARFTTENGTRWQPDSHEKFDEIAANKLEEDGTWTKAYRVLIQSMHMMSQKSIHHFVTREGQLGVTPAKVKAGDLVAALFGGEVLYLLRPTETGHYSFISECYLHGFMDGECLVNARNANGIKTDLSDVTSLIRRIFLFQCNSSILCSEERIESAGFALIAFLHCALIYYGI